LILFGSSGDKRPPALRINWLGPYKIADLGQTRRKFSVFWHNGPISARLRFLLIWTKTGPSPDSFMVIWPKCSVLDLVQNHAGSGPAHFVDRTHTHTHTHTLALSLRNI